MRRHTIDVQVLGPWSLTTSRTFWEGFTPAALPTHTDTGQRDTAQRDTAHGDPSHGAQSLATVFRVEADWSVAQATVTQHEGTARIQVTGDGDLDAAAAQVRRFLSLDVDARGWPAVADRDPVIADAQIRLPGLRPCGFHSPYEAAAWAVLSQRIRIVQAARLRADLIDRHGQAGAFPAPQTLRTLQLDLPGRKTEYLHAVADAALDGQLNAQALRSLDPEQAIRTVQQVKGLGPFAAELVIIRGANTPDVLPRHERRLDAEIALRYGPHRRLADVSETWRPFRTWAVVHLRALREQRTHEIGGDSPRSPDPLPAPHPRPSTARATAPT